DMKLLEHLATGQIALIDVASGQPVRVGAPTMIRSVSMGPSGTQFRVTAMKKPFSYYVPADRFGATEGIWDAEGKNLYTLADRKLRETEPQPATAPTTPTGKGFGMGKQGMAPTPAPMPAPTPPDPDNPMAAAAPP